MKSAYANAAAWPPLCRQRELGVVRQITSHGIRGHGGRPCCATESIYGSDRRLENQVLKTPEELIGT